jgi:hypothetical protein
MLSPEKNDVDISKLFAWGKKFSLNTNSAPLDIYVRLVGDMDLNRARVYALRYSSELRSKLRKEDSDERMAYIMDRDSVTKPQLVNTILLIKIREFGRIATDEVKIKPPKELHSGASLEDQEKFQKEVDDYGNKYKKKIEEKISSLSNSERERLNSLDDKDLYNEYLALVTDDLCENEMYARFREACAYYGSYKDENYKERLFSSLMDFSNLPTNTKSDVIGFYESLEIGTEELKK